MAPINCLIQGVNNDLNGCPSVPTATATSPVVTPTATPTITPGCPLAAGAYTVTQLSGGSLSAYTFAPYAFPAGGSIIEDVSAASLPACVHDVVVPFPDGFSSPNFCVPALGFTVSVTQTGCGIGKIDSNGGSDFDTIEVADTSDSSATCNLPNAGCPPGPPTIGADASIRVDVTVGDGSPDVCSFGTANSIVSIPVHTKSWLDQSGGTPVCAPCPGDCVFNGNDLAVADFNQILDFTTATASGHWADIDGDGCSIAGSGPPVGFAVGKCPDNMTACTLATQATDCMGQKPPVCRGVGTCIDLTAINTPAIAVTTVAQGQFGATGGLHDGSFTNTLPSMISGPAAPLGATCGTSAPVIDFSGTATRCIQ